MTFRTFWLLDCRIEWGVIACRICLVVWSFCAMTKLHEIFMVALRSWVLRSYNRAFKICQGVCNLRSRIEWCATCKPLWLLSLNLALLQTIAWEHKMGAIVRRQGLGFDEYPSLFCPVSARRQENVMVSRWSPRLISKGIRVVGVWGLWKHWIVS